MLDMHLLSFSLLRECSSLDGRIPSSSDTSSKHVCPLLYQRAAIAAAVSTAVHVAKLVFRHSSHILLFRDSSSFCVCPFTQCCTSCRLGAWPCIGKESGWVCGVVLAIATPVPACACTKTPLRLNKTCDCWHHLSKKNESRMPRQHNTWPARSLADCCISPLGIFNF